jgi:hypothetical protein
MSQQVHSTETFEPMPPLPPQFPNQYRPVPLTKKVWFIPAVAATAGLLLGGAVTGSFAATAANTKQANCKAAFEHADAGFGSAAAVIGYLGDGLEAAGRFDADALGDLAPKIEAENEKFKGIPEKYNAARTLCEG